MTEIASNFPLMTYLAFVPFAASLWADVILLSNPRGYQRAGLLWWSFVVGVFWPVVLFGCAVGTFLWGLLLALELIGRSRFGQWLDEEVRP